MHLLVRRHAGGGSGFLRVVAVAFAALAVAAAAAGDWVVFVLALVMIPVALVLIPLSRRVTEGLRASERSAYLERENRRG